MAKSKEKGLGRGLEALLPEEDFLDTPTEIFMCPIEALRPSPYQPRLQKDKGLEELASSVKEKGLLQPILAREITPGIYEIVAGERRFQAARLAGLEKVPVIVKELSPQEALELALIENLQREDLNPIEEARGYQRLMEEFGLTQEEVAQKVGKSRAAIANTLRLLKLPDYIQEDIFEERLSAGHARALLGLAENETLLKHVRDEVIKRGLSVRQTEELVKRLKAGARTKKREKPKDPNLLALEQELAEVIGAKVKISWGGQKGKLVIEFHSSEQFENFLEKLRG
ncbi:ParB/RepB/Spo0J family partition protein [Thermodesulfatator autotrophicus]|uniref:Chromosome partitioning protein ParB n=1 Tax=Thermodesulfatator autotrophicus TaxID=1795632 RepID=A0A177E9S0_9BACT|nr:ParB/RepB/Spo0J family partition protein [Thermodesulfatator autotrophicus]OAG28687.1 chromosome partitioning protein ParB [Thermodesulfatator autotrophicus]